MNEPRFGGLFYAEEGLKAGFVRLTRYLHADYNKNGGENHA